MGSIPAPAAIFKKRRYDMKGFTNSYAIGILLALLAILCMLAVADNINKRHERAASDTLIYQKGLKDGL